MNTIQRVATILGIGALTAFTFVTDASADAVTLDGLEDTTELRAYSGEGYQVIVSDAKAKAGAAGGYTVTIKAVDGYKINDEYPHKLHFDNPPKGLKVDKKLLNAKHDAKLMDKHTLRFSGNITSDDKGNKTLSALVKTSICNTSHCLFKKEKITVEIDAE